MSVKAESGAKLRLGRLELGLEVVLMPDRLGDHGAGNAACLDVGRLVNAHHEAAMDVVPVGKRRICGGLPAAAEW